MRFARFIATLWSTVSLLSVGSAQTITKYNFLEFSPLNYENSFNSAGGQQILAPAGVDLSSVTPRFTFDTEGCIIKTPTPPFDLSQCTSPASAFSITTEAPSGTPKTTLIAVRQLTPAPYHTDGYTLPIPTTANTDPWLTSTTSVGYVHAAMGIANANQWRFGTVSSCLVVGVDFAPRQLSFRLWAISNPVPKPTGEGAFTIEQSADGIQWTQLKNYSKEGEVLEVGNATTPITTLDLLASTRYVKFYYANRSGVNVPLNYLHISAIKREPPTASAISVASHTRTTASLSVTPDKDASLYWLCRAASAPIATAEQLLASSSFAVTAGTPHTQTLTVTTGQDQVIDFLLKDSDGNTSSRYTTPPFSNNTLAINALYTTGKEENNVSLAFSANDHGTLYYRLLAPQEELPSAHDLVTNHTASLPYTTAPDLAHIAVELADDERHTVAVVLQTGNELSALHTYVVKRNDVVDLIRSRYMQWAVGTNTIDLTDPIIKMRHDALTSSINRARQRVAELVITADLPAWNLGGASQTADVAACRDVVGNILLPLTMGYSLPHTDTYHNAAVAEEILHVYTYLAKRNFLNGCTLPFAGGGVYLGLTGYFYGSMLARDLLIQSGKIDEVTDMMQWATRWVTEEDPDWSATAHDNYSRADGVRTIFHNRLLYLLTLHDSDPSREAKLAYLSSALTFHTQLFSAWNGFLKPDYTGYHHLGIWGNAYVTEALHVAAQMAAMLHDTPYAISSTSVENLANGMIAYADYSGLYDINRGLCGRLPQQISNLPLHIPAFAYLYSITQGALQTRLATKFAQLYRPHYAPIQEKMIKGVTASISFFGGMGALERCASLHTLLPTIAVDETLNRSFPYGALQVHRRKDWNVSVKGYSKYVWDFEINGSENWYGRNQSLGQLAIYATPDDAGIVTAEASGLGYNGFDWAHVPGVTSFDMTLPEILQEAKYFEWSKFSSDDYSGSVTNGANGLYATRFMDIRQAYTYSPRVWVGARLEARKSTFFFDDLVLMLGSGIKNTHPDYDAHTTLFQNTLITATTPTMVNGSTYNALNQNYIQTTALPAHFTDAVGNGYYLRNANGLTINRTLQTSRNDRNSADTQGNYATAYINHARATDAAYECAILVRGAEHIDELAANPNARYLVMQQNNVAHIVQNQPTKQTGYAIFDAEGTISSTLVQRVTHPCMLLSTDKGTNQLELSFSNPELGYYPKDKFPFQVWSVDKDKQFAPATHQPFEVTLLGEWQLTTPHPAITIAQYDASSNSTTVRVNAINGESYTALFQRMDATSTPEAPQAEVRLIVHNGQLMVRGASPGETITLYNLLGQPLRTTAATASLTTLDLSALPAGSYLVQIGTAKAHRIRL